MYNTNNTTEKRLVRVEGDEVLSHIAKSYIEDTKALLVRVSDDGSTLRLPHTFLPYPYLNLAIASNLSINAPDLPHICFSLGDGSVGRFLEKIAHTSEIYATYFPSGIRLSITFSEGGRVDSFSFSGLLVDGVGSEVDTCSIRYSDLLDEEHPLHHLKSLIDGFILSSFDLSDDFAEECSGATLSGYLTLTPDAFRIAKEDLSTFSSSESLKDEASLEVVLCNVFLSGVATLTSSSSLDKSNSLVWVVDSLEYSDFSFDSKDEELSTLEAWGFHSRYSPYLIPLELEDENLVDTESKLEYFSSVHEQLVSEAQGIGQEGSELDLGYLVSGVSFIVSNLSEEGTSLTSYLHLPFLPDTGRFKGVVEGIQWDTNFRSSDDALYPFAKVRVNEEIIMLPLYSVKNVYLLQEYLSSTVEGKETPEIEFYLVSPYIRFTPYIPELGGFLSDDFVKSISLPDGTSNLAKVVKKVYGNVNE